MKERTENGAESSRVREHISGKGLVRSLLFGLLGFLFSRVHIVFGARPLGLALLSFSPIEVYAVLIGAAVSEITLGGGIASVAALALALFVRVIIGTAERGAPQFSEPLLLRMASGAIGGFVLALYEWLTAGISVSSALYGAAALLLPPIFVFLFSGVGEYCVADIISGKAALPSVIHSSGGERISAVFFYISSLSLLQLISRSLVGFSFFGIDLPLIFSALAAILAAARLGAVPATLVGVSASLGIAGVQTVSFALLGLISGALFPVGLPYALVGGGLAFCFWSGYSGGLSGVLSSVPELAIAVALSTPLLRLFRTSAVRRERDDGIDTLSLVGTMALSFKSKYSENSERMIASLCSLSTVALKHWQGVCSPTKEEYESAVEECATSFCRECEHFALCEREKICPKGARCALLAKKLLEGGRLSADDINTESEFCERPSELSAYINAKISELEYERGVRVRLSAMHRELSYISRLASDAVARDGEDTSHNKGLSDELSRALSDGGIKNFSAKVFGVRRPYALLAVADPDGKIIASDKVRGAIFSVLGETGGESYYKSQSAAMLECRAREKYSVDFAYKSHAFCEVSGDSAAGIKTSDGIFYGILSDGMGRGEGARRASAYLVELIKNLLSFGAGWESVVGLASRLLERQGDTQATLDLFKFDLFTGDGEMIKCGASPSYLRRGDGIFKISAEGAPLGVGGEGAFEKIRLEVKCGDILVMASDGANDTPKGAISFISRLSGEIKTLSSFAEELLRCGEGQDDKTALVIRISEGGKIGTGA